MRKKTDNFEAKPQTRNSKKQKKRTAVNNKSDHVFSESLRVQLAAQKQTISLTAAIDGPPKAVIGLAATVIGIAILIFFVFGWLYLSGN